MAQFFKNIYYIMKTSCEKRCDSSLNLESKTKISTIVYRCFVIWVPPTSPVFFLKTFSLLRYAWAHIAVHSSQVKIPQALTLAVSPSFFNVTFSHIIKYFFNNVTFNDYIAIYHNLKNHYWGNIFSFCHLENILPSYDKFPFTSIFLYSQLMI